MNTRLYASIALAVVGLSGMAVTHQAEACGLNLVRAANGRWTIAPPARVLAPRSSASFNSAEVDVPKGGDELTVTLGG